MYVVLDSLSLPECGDEEFEDVETKLGEVGTFNVTELTGMFASLQVIEEEIDWEDIADNLTWGDDDDHPVEDEAEEAMQMGDGLND
jgi:hypothetical protein